MYIFSFFLYTDLDSGLDRLVSDRYLAPRATTGDPGWVEPEPGFQTNLTRPPGFAPALPKRTQNPVSMARLDQLAQPRIDPGTFSLCEVDVIATRPQVL